MEEKDIDDLVRTAKKRGILPRNVVTFSEGKFVAAPDGDFPALDLGWPLKTLAQALGLLAKQSDFFRLGEQFVTVDPLTGNSRPMTPARFCSWVEAVAWPFRMVESRTDGQYHERYKRLSREIAQLVMESDEFRGAVRELRGIHEVRLPVWRGHGKDRRIELLPEGYDEQSGIFTADAIPFEHEFYSKAQAFTWLAELLHDYPWANETSRAIHFAAMISPFVRLLLPPGAKRLMMIHIANQAGTGKSTLSRMALAGVYGAAATKPDFKGGDELRKQFDTCAFERKPYLFLDNMTNLRSPELNAFVTSGRWSARVLGKSQTEEVTIEAQIFLNGNQLDVGRELARRAAVCELFLATDPLGRKFDREISDEWLIESTTRRKLLAVAWAAVKHWQDDGMKIDPHAKRPSFETYTELVGSIVAAFGMGAPFAAAALVADTEGEATKELLDAAAAQVFESGAKEREFTNPQLIAIAEERHLLEVIVPYATKDVAKSLGIKLKTWRGRILTDKLGRRYEFGKRDGRLGALYWLTINPPE